MKPLRFAVAQTNPTVGDYAGNTRKIISSIEAAESKGADLIIFPEMALCGYPVWDLANKKSFVHAGLKSLRQIADSTRKMKITIALGYIASQAKGNSRAQNAMAWIARGKTQATYIKRLLPTYDVFLEQIFFTPGQATKTIAWKGLKVGPTICEDIWDQNYSLKPLRELRRQKADLVINISASPYFSNVAEIRENLIRRQCRKYKLPMLYVNQVGGQDDLIFDGRSLFADENGKVIFRAPAFEEGIYYFDWKHPSKVHAADKMESAEEIYQALVLGVKDYCRKNNFKKVVLGLSGGIDSALVAVIAVDALGADAVLGVTMPSKFSSEGSWKDSQELAENLGIRCVMHSIKNKFDLMIKEIREHQRKESGQALPLDRITLAEENLQARLRGIELMYISNDGGRLVLTTGNKSELAMGYCTLYGDMAGGLCVIGDVFKTDVYRLARYRNSVKKVIPESILKKAPSAELRPNQKDQDSLPPYEVLDAILRLYIEENLSPAEIIKKLTTKHKKHSLQTLVSKVIRQVDHNEYKRRQTPPILRVTSKAWFGRRMPITNRFEPS